MLTFREGRTAWRSKPPHPSECIEVSSAVNEVTPNTVLLHVYDLASGMSSPNALLCNDLFKTFGAFHVGVEVYGQEFSFYGEVGSTKTGISRSIRRRHHPVHVYRETITLGTTALQSWEVEFLLRGHLAPAWIGGEYNLLTR